MGRVGSGLNNISMENCVRANDGRAETEPINM